MNKVTEISFELHGVVYTKYYSIPDARVGYRRYSAINGMLCNPGPCSKSTFLTALKAARKSNIIIITNFISKPKTEKAK